MLERCSGPPRDERQTSQKMRDGKHVVSSGDRVQYGLIQLLRLALASLPPPLRGAHDLR